VEKSEMNVGLAAFLAIFMLTFILKIPIPLGFITGTSFYLLLNGMDLSLIAEKVLSNLYSKYIIMAVPLFVFTAKVMNSGKVTEKVFNFANALVGKLPGGLGHVNVLASLIFSGMTGSALADASGLGIMEIEAMRKEGYEDGFSCGVTAASATIGPVFPPSIPMVFYSMLSGASIGNLFLGGMIPGVLIAVALMVYIAIVAKRRNYPRGIRYTLRNFIIFTINAFPALLTPVILLGGIYTGIITPTEAGAIAALYAIIISFLVYRSMSPRELLDVLIDTVKTTGTVSIIVGSSFCMAFVVANERIPALVANLILNLTTNKYVFLLIVNIVFLILGMFINVSTLTLVFIPIVLPVIEKFGIDLVHFGVVIVLNMMIGLSTPPYGGLLFITSGISNTALDKIIREIFPMLIVLIGVLLLITYVPQIVMFLPNQFGR
jgi:tripartite ATP-independent transporter DctM subunit